MDILLYILFTGILIRVAYSYIQAIREKKKSKYRDMFIMHWPLIAKANKSYDRLCSGLNYFAESDQIEWLELAKPTVEFCQKNKYDNIGLDKKMINEVNRLCTHYESIKDNRKLYNEKFITNEIRKYSKLFGDIEGRRLDLQQSIAVVTDEDNNLVIAGAGSGKTTTIVGKVHYLLKKFRFDKNQIMLVSFTAKSCGDLLRRVGDNVSIPRTFHSHAARIISEVEGGPPSIYDGASLDRLIKTRLKTLAVSDSTFSSLLAKYFAIYQKPFRPQEDFSNHGEYIQYLKDHNLKTLKKRGSTRQTMYREIVKSYQECMIANFLFINGIDYEYEATYEYDTRNENFRSYKPDFTINCNGRKIYLEHFGINKNGEVPKWFASQGQSHQEATQRYQEKMIWAKALHQENDTLLIDTYSYQFNDGSIYRLLKKSLVDFGVEIKPMTAQALLTYIENEAKTEMTQLITFLRTLISLLKSNKYSLEDYGKIIDQKAKPYDRKRAEVIFKILSPIYNSYEEFLTKRKEVDFSDLINRATDYINGGLYKPQYRYIVVDEFQDISISRFQFIKALQTNSSRHCKTFCVGDDWQSIFRFAGSDMGLFKDFQEYFGTTAISRIETTYRFAEPVLSCSSDFVQANPNQSKKQLERFGEGNNTTKFFICEYDSKNPDENSQLDHSILTLKKILDVIIQEDEDPDIMLIGRYSFDFDNIFKNAPVIEGMVIRRLENKNLIIYNGLSIPFITAHKSKGLEADHVIILNCNSGTYGFPCQRSDDPSIGYLLTDADNFPNGEERRLFYVAMTRARENLFIMCQYDEKSSFLLEIEKDDPVRSQNRCPSCDIGTIRMVKEGLTSRGSLYQFYGCTNYNIGCTYSHTSFIEDQVKIEEYRARNEQLLALAH